MLADSSCKHMLALIFLQASLLWFRAPLTGGLFHIEIVRSHTGAVPKISRMISLARLAAAGVARPLMMMACAVNVISSRQVQQISS